MYAAFIFYDLSEIFLFHCVIRAISMVRVSVHMNLLGFLALQITLQFSHFLSRSGAPVTRLVEHQAAIREAESSTQQKMLAW